jgi:hypothetical protein
MGRRCKTKGDLPSKWLFSAELVKLSLFGTYCVQNVSAPAQQAMGTLWLALDTARHSVILTLLLLLFLTGYASR